MSHKRFEVKQIVIIIMNSSLTVRGAFTPKSCIWQRISLPYPHVWLHLTQSQPQSLKRLLNSRLLMMWSSPHACTRSDQIRNLSDSQQIFPQIRGRVTSSNPNHSSIHVHRTWIIIHLHRWGFKTRILGLWFQYFAKFLFLFKVFCLFMSASV